MKLLPEELLLKTSSLDRAHWNYHGILQHIQRSRFQAVREILSDTKFKHILEIGYGSGIFLPELAKHCHRLSGVDIHGHSQQVAQNLQTVGTSVELHQAQATCLPFEDKQIDAVVSVSALEFVDDLNKAAGELKRILTPDGTLVVVAPVKSLATDLALFVLKGQRASTYYGQGREMLYPALSRVFSCDKHLYLPMSMAWAGIRIYNVWSFTPRPESN